MVQLAGTRTTLLVAANLPLLFFGMGSGFITMVFSTGLSSVFYPYALIPLLTVISITVIHSHDVLAAFRWHSGWPRPPYVNKKV